MTDEKTEKPEEGEGPPPEYLERMELIRGDLERAMRDMAGVLLEQIRIMPDGRITVHLDIRGFKIDKAGYVIQRGFNYGEGGNVKENTAV